MTFKPGCFGSSLCYSDISLPCTLCPHREACGPVAEAVALELREKYHIQDAVIAANRAISRQARKRPARSSAHPVASVAAAAPRAPASTAPLPRPVALPAAGAGVPRPVTPADPEAPLSALPVKSVELRDRLAKRGIDLKRAIARGVNPFEAQPPAFMRTLTRMLLAGPFTREEATKRLCEDLGWAQSSASSHVSLALPVMIAAGVARIENNQVVRSTA